MNDEIAVRAYTVPKIRDFRAKNSQNSKQIEHNRILVLDCETTTDLYQNLKFGYFEVYEYGILDYYGIFYDPDILKKNERKILVNFTKKKAIPIHTIEEFRKIFLYEIFDLQTLCVGFNLPFDLTRIAIKSANARLRRKNGFSLLFSKNLNYPRLHIIHVTNTFSFIEWGNTKNKFQNFKGNFVDLRTLGHALTDQKHSLESACLVFKTQYQKQIISDHGKITTEYIEYCINDVKATYSLYQNAKNEFENYGLDIPITKTYTPATIGKEFLNMIGIRRFLEKNPDFPNELLGKITVSYYGGRTEDKVRKTPMLVDVLDFLSMYPTVCTLQKLWKFVIADHIGYKDDTEKIRNFIDNFKLVDIQNKKIWSKLQGIILVEPENDILPVRAKYGTKNVWNIGVNYLTSRTPLWYSIADVITSKLYTEKTPKILKAYRFVPVGIQADLKTINIHGTKINPYHDDLFKKLIEYRHQLQMKKDPREHIIKIITNSISYGIFVEITTLEETKKLPIEVYGLSNFVQHKEKIERPGYMFNPIIAVCITSASRLLLAITEILLSKHGKAHAYCDTDSMMISPKHTKEVQRFFQPLNPYNFDAEIFKREKSNVLFYGISAKRYCLYRKIKKKIKIEKHSSHGLGHLLDPFSSNLVDNDKWHKEIWKDILNLHYKNITIEQLMEKYHNKFALSKFVITNPRILDRLREFNKNQKYQNQIKPFNFSIVGFSNLTNQNTSELIKPLAPFRKPAKLVVYDYFTDYYDKSRPKLKGKQYWKPFWDTFLEYLNHPEAKFEGNEGSLQRKHIRANRILHIGKESYNLEESEILGVDSDSYEIYENLQDLEHRFKCVCKKVLDLKPKDVKKYGISRQTLWNTKTNIGNNKTDVIAMKTKKLLLQFVLDHSF